MLVLGSSSPWQSIVLTVPLLLNPVFDGSLNKDSKQALVSLSRDTYHHRHFLRERLGRLLLSNNKPFLATTIHWTMNVISRLTDLDP